MKLQDTVNTFFANLEHLVSAKTVFGDPITVGDTTIIPVVDITFGMGTGVGSGEKGAHETGSGGGGGAGARMVASAIIVVRGDYVQVVQIKKTTYIENLIDMVPELVNKLSGNPVSTAEEKSKVR